MIGHGDNGPSAKPLFSTFRAEGHVTSTCLWHACRAVTIGALLIVMGMAMSILGKFNFNLRFLKPSRQMEGHRAAQKMNLFYYRGCVNHNFKVPPKE